MPASISTGAEQVVLEHGPLRVELSLRPFSLTVRRGGRRLLRAGGVWVADGTIHDHFVQFTEGVVPREDLSPRERALRATIADRDHDGVQVALSLHGGRQARLFVRIAREDRVSLELTADGEPLRLAVEWDRRSEERLVGLGARHGTQFDQAGRRVQLGADRRYTGPDCPAEMLADGGIPQGDCAPTPWLLSSRGYGVWVQTDANGTCFDLAGERIAVSTRAQSGPLRLQLLCAATPAARLRDFCRLTGFPALLPEWGYGFWKSRDVYEHQDDVLDDFNGSPRARDPARRDRDRFPVGDAVQHLGIQSAPIPRRAGDDRDDARRTVCGPSSGARRGSTSIPGTVRSHRSLDPSGCIASPRRATRPARPPVTSCADPTASRS